MRSMSVEAEHLGDGRVWCKQTWGAVDGMADRCYCLSRLGTRLLERWHWLGGRCLLTLISLPGLWTNNG
jgi:hypothetical protein